MHARLSEVWPARRIGRNLRPDPLELSPPNVLQTLPLGRGGGRLVQINRNLKPLPNLRAHVASHGHAVFNRHAINRNERHYVGRAHPRVRPLMLGQVNQLRGLPDPANRGFLNGVALAHQRNDAAVVIGVHLPIQQKNARDLHRLDNRVDFRLVPAFGKIRNAFNQSGRHTREG